MQTADQTVTQEYVLEFLTISFLESEGSPVAVGPSFICR